MTPTQTLPSRMIGVANRIPASLDLLAGPDQGRVALPVRLAWSGLTEYDIDDPRERLTLYCLLLDCGQHDDIVRYVNARLLQHDWPRIRRLTARRMIALWERRMTELAVA